MSKCLVWIKNKFLYVYLCYFFYFQNKLGYWFYWLCSYNIWLYEILDVDKVLDEYLFLVWVKYRIFMGVYIIVLDCCKWSFGNIWYLI